MLLLVIQVFDANFRPTQATNLRQGVMPEAQATGVADPANSNPPGSGTAAAGLFPAWLQLDNNTSAAMIAADNAALTAPQFLVDLPMISR